MKDVCSRFASHRYCSKIDFKAAYEQARLVPELVPFSSFVTPNGAFASNVMQQGDVNAPKTMSLSKPKRVRVAIKGDEYAILSEFVRVPIRLENGSWKCGLTTLIITPLGDAFAVILGFSSTVAPLSSEPLDLLTPVYGPPTAFQVIKDMDNDDEKTALAHQTAAACAVQLEEDIRKLTDEEREMKERADKLAEEFADLFPSSLPPFTADYLSRTSTRHRIKLVDSNKVHNQRGFNIPRKWRERWKRMLEEHLAAGRVRPSTSLYASAAFVVPKKDPKADPRWVNDYRHLNSNTVKDRTPLPLPDLVLADAALAKVWGKIDMTNTFFQTPMDEDDIAKTAIKTPWGLFEWTVMPQGLCNVPATHQARVNEALRHLVGVCCQAFVDDIIIYSNSMAEREENCRAVLSALRAAGLYCSKKKTDLFTLLSHVRGFLGLVQYLRKFIPCLAEHTAVLTPLMRKGLTNVEDLWTDKEEQVFLAIKRIVSSLPVLKAVDQDSKEPIWLMTDASKIYSRQYIPAEKNYPMHEQELLAVVAAMKEWRIDLLGVHFHVLTHHDTLKHFGTHATLSKRQARWTETLADYDYELSYIPGKLNTVADSLSRFSFPGDVPEVVRNLGSSKEFSMKDGLIYFESNRIVVPAVEELCEALLHDGHDALGHLGSKKTLSSLSSSFFWPGMRKDMERYVESCDGCQRHKSRTTRKAGKLHLLPVPPRAFSDVALDFVGPLPSSDGKDILLTITDRLTGYTHLFPCRSKDGAKEIADIFFRGWFALFGLPERVVSDRDKLFTSKFWRVLHSRLGISLQLSTTFHPETDGRSERTNKTVVQMLRQYVSREQRDWVRYLPTLEYAINAAVNDSTGTSPFELVLGNTPSILPSPLSHPSGTSPSLPAVDSLIDERTGKIQEAREALAAAKVRQAEQANSRRKEELTFSVGDLVMVDSTDRRARYKSSRAGSRAAKLFPRYDGPPYPIAAAFPETLTYRLTLPDGDRSHPTFHVSKLKAYHLNDAATFPSRTLPRPEPIDVEGREEYEVERIVDEKGKGVRRFLVKWEGYPESENSWEPLKNVEDTAAMDAWEQREWDSHS
ncbi:hypothetical protein JCM1841_001868 [Sporobolomyces salmonicolor]